MGLYAGVDFNSPYLIVNSIVSYPTPPLQKERDIVGKISPIGWAHLYLLISKTGLLCKHKTEKGEGRGES